MMISTSNDLDQQQQQHSLTTTATFVLMEPEVSNKVLVESLYDALAKGDSEKASSVLAHDLEWWFHGPPTCQYMMRILTGQSSSNYPDKTEFVFRPQSFTAIGSKVFVEGWEGESVYWVHVWSVVAGGLITQVREYFNTWITVQDVSMLFDPTATYNKYKSSSSSSSGRNYKREVWRSELDHDDQVLGGAAAGNCDDQYINPNYVKSSTSSSSRSLPALVVVI